MKITLSSPGLHHLMWLYHFISCMCVEAGMPQPLLNRPHEEASSIAPNASNDALCACVNPFAPLISSRS